LALQLYSKRLEAGLFYHTKNKVQSLSSIKYYSFSLSS
jgi:hypothetical protein